MQIGSKPKVLEISSLIAFAIDLLFSYTKNRGSDSLTARTYCWKSSHPMPWASVSLCLDWAMDQ